MRVYVYYIGKPRDGRANEMALEYLKRAGRYSKCEMIEIQPDRFDLWSRRPSASKVLLDPAGKVLTSHQFAEVVAKAELEARDLAFVIGGHDGLPPAWREKADWLLSLSAMTYPHELARVMLAEQIYRAFTILRGHPYPR